MHKKVVVDTIRKMSEKFELDDLIERLIILNKIERGQKDIESRKTTSHFDAKEHLSKWLR